MFLERGVVEGHFALRQIGSFGEPGAAPIGKTTFNSVPQYVKENWQPSSDDIVITVEESSADNDEHWFFESRSAGSLSLMLDYKPGTGAENLFLQSDSQGLIEAIADEVESRKAGI